MSQRLDWDEIKHSPLGHPRLAQAVDGLVGLSCDPSIRSRVEVHRFLEAVE